MGLKKWKDLFFGPSKKKRKVKSKKPTLKKVDGGKSPPSSRPSQKSSTQIDKVEIENLKNLIEKKLQDPEMAKKASMIISSYLKKK